MKIGEGEVIKNQIAKDGLIFPPKYLYRYCGNPEFILDLLLNKHIYHSLPSEFNDPFDCKPFIALKSQRCKCTATWYKAFCYLARTQHPNKPIMEIQTGARQAIDQNQYNNPAMLDKLERHLKDLGNIIRVCCFGVSPRNSMLWAHYAANQKGVAFQFRSAGLTDGASQSFRGFRVDYRRKPLDIEDYARAMEDAFENKNPFTFAELFYCSKSEQWVGEQEVRFFCPHDQKFIEFNEPALQSIIFGSSCSETLERTIRTTIATWTHKPRLFKTSVSKSSVKLYIEHC